MPFVSKAQQRKFRQLVADGKMSKDTYDKWENETNVRRLPEYGGKSRKTNKVIR